MTSPDVRAAVEAAIRRHLDARRPAPGAAVGPRPSASSASEPRPSAPPPHGPSRLPAGRRGEPGPEPSAPPPPHGLSHARFDRAALAGDPRDGRCVMEPSVECTGSGHCRSLGH